MARQTRNSTTRNSRRSKPGVTIDGTAEDKSAGDAKSASDAKGTTDASAAKGSATGSATSGTATSSTTGSGPSKDANAPAGTTSATSGATEPKTAGMDAASASAASGAKTSGTTPTATDATGKDANGKGGATGGASTGIATSGAVPRTEAGKPAPVTSGPSASGPSASGPGASGATKPGTTTTGTGTGTAKPASAPATGASKPIDARRADNDNRGSGLVPGLIGGAVALAGAWVLSLLGLFGGGNADEVAALRAELAEVQAAIPGEGVSLDTVTALDERVAQIEAIEGQRADAGIVSPEVEARIATIESALAEGATGTDAAIDLTPLETRLAALEAIGASEGGENVAAIEERIAAIDARLGEGDGEAREALNALSARLEELSQNQSATLAETGANVGAAVAAIATVRDTIDALRGDVETLEAAVATGTEETGTRLAGIDGGIETVTTRVETIRTQIANLERNADATNGRVGEIAASLETATTRLDDVAGRVDDLSGLTDQIGTNVEANASQLADLARTVEESRSDTTVARAIAATNLKSAIDRGTSFAPELEAYTSVAAEPGEIEALAEFAGRGVPTLAELFERFDAVSRDIIATRYAVGEDAGVADQLGASLRSLVQTRPIGEAASGSDTSAIVTRMEGALESGDLAAVIAEGEALEGAAAEEAQPFLEDVRARMVANELVDSALSKAIRPAG